MLIRRLEHFVDAIKEALERGDVEGIHVEAIGGRAFYMLVQLSDLLVLGKRIVGGYVGCSGGGTDPCKDVEGNFPRHLGVNSAQYQ